MSEVFTQIDGTTLKLTNLEKELWPESHITKAEFIQYYLSVSEKILSFINGRPLTLIRYPDGINSKPFYSKNAPSFTPDHIKTVMIDQINYLCLENKAGLIYVANLAALELHPMALKYDKPGYPDCMIFDFDPSEDVPFEKTKEVTLKFKNMLISFGYHPFLKTSGGKGLHIYVPIHPAYTVDVVVNSAKSLAQAYIDTDKETTMTISKEKRIGKILIDIYRNHSSQTCVAPYSTRAKPQAPVSMPLDWDELPGLTSSAQYNLRNCKEKILNNDPWQHFFANQTKLHPTLTKSITVDIKPDIPKIELPSSPTSFPNHVPMLADQVSQIPMGGAYLFEIKWDGIRVTVLKDKNSVIIKSKTGADITSKFPEIASGLSQMNADIAIYDGELISSDPSGKPVFAQIISRMHASSPGKSPYKAQLYIFDITWYNGVNLSSHPLEERQSYLKRSIVSNDHIKISEAFEDGQSLWEAVKHMGMEGIIAKKKGSAYTHGLRSASWLKIKVRSTVDATIIGYTKGKGDRSASFGALHIAKINGDQYHYLGKVGSGFNTDFLKSFFMVLTSKPVISKPVKEAVEEESQTIWISDGPECEVQYASITPNGTLREPVLVKIRTPEE